MKRLATLLTALAPSTALAHSGHGAITDPVLHLLGEPAHALPLLALVAGGLAFGLHRWAEKARTR